MESYVILSIQEYILCLCTCWGLFSHHRNVRVYLFGLMSFQGPCPRLEALLCDWALSCILKAGFRPAFIYNENIFYACVLVGDFLIIIDMRLSIWGSLMCLQTNQTCLMIIKQTKILNNGWMKSEWSKQSKMFECIQNIKSSNMFECDQNIKLIQTILNVFKTFKNVWMYSNIQKYLNIFKSSNIFKTYGYRGTP